MRRTIVIALAFLAAAGAAAGVTAAVMRTPESNGVSRIERAMKLNAESFHDLDFGFQASAFIPYTTPASVESVDVTVTMTFRYRTSRGDAGSFSAFLNDETPFPDTLSLPMRPSIYRLSGAPSGKTVTLTWIRRDVAASGKQYTVVLSPELLDRNGDAHADIRTVGAAAVVIESWTAGD